MIRINLLPFRVARKRESIRRIIFVFSFSLVIALVVVFMWGRVLDKEVREKQNLLTTNQKKAATLEAQSRKSDAIRKELDILETKLKIMASLEKGRRQPVDIFEALTEAIIPQRIWLSEYKVEKDRLRIIGFALDDKTIADFMTNLEKSGLFTAVSLDNVQQKVQGKITLRAFSLSCQEKKV
ncbi:PilN domain-containing protein [Desulfococcaceae bacterium OttesenSCG-928-F15]|nr:PilN domain-containing protein [Desulfococcaceae bacterium OttesenSCG-928-F15]